MLTEEFSKFANPQKNLKQWENTTNIYWHFTDILLTNLITDIKVTDNVSVMALHSLITDPNA